MIRKAIIVVLTLAAVLMVFLWAVTLWFNISYWQAQDVLYIGDGAICIQWWDEVESSSLGWHVFRNRTPVILIPRLVSRQGRLSGMDVPLWLPFLLFAAYPTIAFIRGPLRRWRRRRQGLCVRCGYDLTGNVSGVCPECVTKT